LFVSRAQLLEHFN